MRSSFELDTTQELTDSIGHYCLISVEKDERKNEVFSHLSFYKGISIRLNRCKYVSSKFGFGSNCCRYHESSDPKVRIEILRSPYRNTHL